MSAAQLVRYTVEIFKTSNIVQSLCLMLMSASTGYVIICQMYKCITWIPFAGEFLYSLQYKHVMYTFWFDLKWSEVCKIIYIYIYFSAGSLCTIRVSTIEETELSKSLPANCTKDTVHLYDYSLWFKGNLLYNPGKVHLKFVFICQLSFRIIKIYYGNTLFLTYVWKLHIKLHCIYCYIL